jgi:hypothetical protein
LLPSGDFAEIAQFPVVYIGLVMGRSKADLKPSRTGWAKFRKLIGRQLGSEAEELMANSVYVIVLGAAADVETPGLTPTADDVRAAQHQLTTAGYDLRLMLLDPNYRLAKSLAPVKEDFDHLGQINVDRQHFRDYPPEVLILDDHYGKLPEEVKATSLPVIFLSYLPMTSAYQLMSLMNHYQTTNRYYVIATELTLMTTIAEDFLTRDQPDPVLREPYNPYLGGVLPATMEYGDRQDCLRQMVAAAFVAMVYIKAGYDRRENLVDVPGWCLNPETPCLKGAIATYGLISPVPDAIPIHQMVTNSGYRMQIFEVVSKMVANFVINNRMLEVEAIAQLGGWRSAATYEFLGTQILKPIYAQTI